jgi:hypothetical protein
MSVPPIRASSGSQPSPATAVQHHTRSLQRVAPKIFLAVLRPARHAPRRETFDTFLKPSQGKSRYLKPKKHHFPDFFVNNKQFLGTTSAGVKTLGEARPGSSLTF